MAQDVNQSEMDVATQVRLALVARISHERYELWMPEESRWHYGEGTLTINMPHEFSRNIAKRMLHEDLREVVDRVIAPAANIVWQVAEPEESQFVLVGAIVDTQADGSAVIVSDEAVPARHTDGLVEHTYTEQLTTLQVDSDQSESTVDVQTADEVGYAARKPMSQPLPKPHAHEAVPKADLWSEFIPGPSNQMAWTTINMIAADPGSMTPALLHGPFGVGKSHLATALAQRLRSQRRQRRVVHITAEQFTNDFTEALRGSGLPMMRRKYRDVDTLILDDLQFLLNKKATIGELRQTLDNLLKNQKQVVFLSDRPLLELEGLGQDFIGRLRGGLVTPLLPLDEATRYQILKRDLRICEVVLSDDIVLQIAARAIGDGRLLKGIVKRLMATSYLNEHPLTWDESWNAIYDLIQATQPIVRLGDIERVVCEVFGLEPESLQSDRKTRQVSQPRMLAMFLARKYTPAAYQEIGEYFGKRRHSTVISAEKTVGAWLEDNTSLQLPRGRLSIREALRHVEANLHVG